MKDFPAAHSMDSTWFAVDEDGEVAVFDTASEGPIPLGGFPVHGDEEGAFDEGQMLARVLWAKASLDPRLRALLPAKVEALEESIDDSDEWELIEPILRALGAWYYRGDEGAPWPYRRTNVPAQPVKLTELDEDTQSRFADAKLPVRFRQESMIAPGEFRPVYAWRDHWFDREGQPHAAHGREEAFQRVVDQLPTGGLPIVGQEEGADERLEGEALYDAVAKLLAS